MFKLRKRRTLGEARLTITAGPRFCWQHVASSCGISSRSVCAPSRSPHHVLDSFSIGDLQSRVAHVPMIANILCWRCWRYKLLARHP